LRIVLWWTPRYSAASAVCKYSDNLVMVLASVRWGEFRQSSSLTNPTRFGHDSSILHRLRQRAREYEISVRIVATWFPLISAAPRFTNAVSVGGNAACLPPSDGW
jgi:hypothetical protein